MFGSCHFSGCFCLFVQKFWEMAVAYECSLSFYDCRLSGEDSQRLDLCLQSHLNFLPSKMVGALKHLSRTPCAARVPTSYQVKLSLPNI